MYICTSCQPAGVEVPQIDDMVGRCDGCSQVDGNLRRYTPNSFVAAQGSYITATGKMVAVR